MASQLEIVNAAFGIFAVDPVEDLDASIELDDEPRSALSVYRFVRDPALALHPWSWLYERQELSRDDSYDGAREPYRSRFIVAPRNVVVRAVYDSESSDYGIPEGWKRRGRYLYSNTDRLWWDVQTDEVPEEVMPTVFSTGLVQDLAGWLAINLVRDLATARYYHGLAANSYQKAITLDTQSQPNEVVEDYEWVSERISSGRGYHGIRLDFATDLRTPEELAEQGA